MITTISPNLWNTFARFGSPDWGTPLYDLSLIAIIIGFVLAIIVSVIIGVIIMLLYHWSCTLGSNKLAAWFDSASGNRFTAIILAAAAGLCVALAAVDGFNVKRHIRDTYTTETVSATGYKKLARGKYQFELPDNTRVTTKPQVKLIYTRDKTKNNKLQKARLVITHMKDGYKRPECWIPRVKKSTLYQYKYSTSNTGNSSDMQEFE